MERPVTSAPLDLVTMLADHVRVGADAPCLLFGEEVIAFGELAARSDKVAGALAGQGVRPGDRIAILALSGPVFFELLFGCAKAGAIMVPINSRLSAREVGEILTDAEPALLVVDDALARLVPDGLEIPVLSTGDFAAWRDRCEPVTPVPVEPDDPVLILYTSGTTALPKGVVLSHRNLSYLGRMAGELWEFTADSTNLAAMPLFHIGGIGWGMLALSQGGGQC